jgi:hypothetical protein
MTDQLMQRAAGEPGDADRFNSERATVNVYQEGAAP